MAKGAVKCSSYGSHETRERYAKLLISKLVCINLVFFLYSQFQSTNLCLSLCHSFDYCSFIESSQIRKYESSHFVLLYKIVLTIWGPSQFHINFRISLPIFTQKVTGIFDGNCAANRSINNIKSSQGLMNTGAFPSIQAFFNFFNNVQFLV